MQNAELFRRGVVMPLSSDAEEDLRNNDVEPSSAVAYVEIRDDEFFYRLWNTTVFERVNAAIESNLDDYEEEWIAPGKIVHLSRVVESVRGELEDGQVRDWLCRLIELAARAKDEGKPLLFVF